MQGKIITIFGGSGFIGRYVVQKLVQEGALLRIAVRHPDQVQQLKPMGQVGQITPIRVDVTDKKSITDAIGSADVVINLMGILYERGPQTFAAVHVQAPQNIAQVAKKKGVQQLIHISAIGANPSSASKYAASKGLGEKHLKTTFTGAIIVRPSVVFGPEDKFLNRFAQMAVYFPALPLFGGGKAKIQPVYVGDVAEAIVRLVKSEGKVSHSPYRGKIFELGGPHTYTWKQIWQFVLAQTRRRRMLVSLPYSLGVCVGKILQWLPQPPLTADQVKLLRQDNIVASKSLTFKSLDITPTAMELLAPEYLKRYRYYG